MLATEVTTFEERQRYRLLAAELEKRRTAMAQPASSVTHTDANQQVWISVGDAAKALKVKNTAIYHRIQKNTIKSKKTDDGIKILKSSVDDILKSREKESVSGKRFPKQNCSRCETPTVVRWLKNGICNKCHKDIQHQNRHEVNGLKRVIKKAEEQKQQLSEASHAVSESIIENKAKHKSGETNAVIHALIKSMEAQALFLQSQAELFKTILVK